MSPKEPEVISSNECLFPQDYPMTDSNAGSPTPEPNRRKISVGIQIHPPSGELVRIQKNKPPAISINTDGEFGHIQLCIEDIDHLRTAG